MIEEDFSLDQSELDDISVEFDNENVMQIKDINSSDVLNFAGGLNEELDGENIAKHFMAARDKEDPDEISDPKSLEKVNVAKHFMAHHYVENDSDNSTDNDDDEIPIEKILEKSDKEVSPLSDGVILINNSKVSIRDLQKQLDNNSIEEKKPSLENFEVFSKLNPYKNLIQKCDIFYYLRSMSNVPDDTQFAQRIRNWDALNLHYNAFTKTKQPFQSLIEDNLSFNTISTATELRTLVSGYFQQPSPLNTLQDYAQRQKISIELENENIQLKKANEILMKEISELSEKNENGFGLQTVLELKEFYDPKRREENDMDSFEKIKLIEEKYSKEMESLRKYFEKKCINLEKQ